MNSKNCPYACILMLINFKIWRHLQYMKLVNIISKFVYSLLVNVVYVRGTLVKWLGMLDYD